MANPVLIEITRGARVESRHRGAILAVDASGAPVLSVGDVDAMVYPRSAVKAIQALALVESGAANALGLGAAELALACSSHNAEPAHVETARGMLARAGLSEADLDCGAQWPRRLEDQAAMIRAGAAPGAIHNNCSGKHAGFLCVAARMGWPVAGYGDLGHPVQRLIAANLEALTGAPHNADMAAVDGCSIPTFAAPLASLARGFARFTSGVGLSPERAAAAKRLETACMAEPFMVAGSERFCTALMQVAPGRVFAKTGAEGVFCGALPELGLGIALKADDGATRAAEAMMASTVAALLPLEGDERARMAALTTREIRNWNGVLVGEARLAADAALGRSSGVPR